MSRHGWIVALEGPEDVVSKQLELLPDSPLILKLPNIRESLQRHSPHTFRGLNVKPYIWFIHNILQSRLETAQKFLAAAEPGTRRFVFMHGGAVTAQRTCINAIRRHVPEVRDDLGLGSMYFQKVVEKGEFGLFEHFKTRRRTTKVAPDAGTVAMRAAESLDDRTAYLQPDPLSQTAKPLRSLPDEDDSNDEGGPSNAPVAKDVANVPDQLVSRFSKWSTSDSTDARNTKDVANDPDQLISRFSKWSTSDELSEGHGSTHLSTAQEVSFQQARIVPVSDDPEQTTHKDEDTRIVPVSEDPARITPKEGETSDISLDSNGQPRPPRRVREARRNEALRMLEGQVEPDRSFQPVMLCVEDVVFLLIDESSSVSLEWLASEYKKGNPAVGGKEISPKTAAEDEERFMQIYNVESFDDEELQHEIRSQLKAFFVKHDPDHDYSELDRLHDRRQLSPASLAALVLIEEHADLILAVGAQQGVNKETYEAIVDKLVKLGKPDGKTYSRAGRIEYRNLLGQVMVAHTSQPLFQQTINPLANPSKTAEGILPHIAAHVVTKSAIRFLVIDFSHRHLPTILALRQFIGRKKFKIAGIVVKDSAQPGPRPAPSSASSSGQPEKEPSPLARNPVTLLPFSEAADWTMVVNSSADATEKLNLSTKVWRALREANEWYNPGSDKGKERAADNRISIAVTSEGKSRAPPVTRPLSTAKRPLGYELGKSNFSRPMVPVGPASPPESIPASPDGPAPPAHPAPPPPAPPPPSPPPPPPPPAHFYGAAPASPEPTIGSAASGSSASSKWKELVGKFHKRVPTPTGGSGARRVTKKLSALFARAPEDAAAAAARGRVISTPIPPPTLPALAPPPPPRHAADAAATEADDEDEDDHDDDTMDEEERRVLGRFGSRRVRAEDDKARRLLGLPK